MGLAFTMAASVTLSGCGTGKKDSGKTEIELVQYKPEAVKAFEKLEEKFNATHDDIHLTIESPNDAMTVLKTRFIREDNPDIIGIGGDVNFSNFIDSDMLMDISDYQGLDSIKDACRVFCCFWRSCFSFFAEDSSSSSFICCRCSFSADGSL